MTQTQETHRKSHRKISQKTATWETGEDNTETKQFSAEKFRPNEEAQSHTQLSFDDIQHMKRRLETRSKLDVPEERRGSVKSGGKGVLWVISRAHKNSRVLQSEGRFLPLAGLCAAANEMFSGSQLHCSLKHTVKQSGCITWRSISRNQPTLLYTLFTVSFSFRSDLVAVNTDVNGRESDRGQF